jgi:hypothetical protein
LISHELLNRLSCICYDEVRIGTIKGVDAMEDRFDEMGDPRLMILENKASQIRKLMLGSLLLAKDTWKDELLSTPQGLDVLKTIEEAEEEFYDTSLSNAIEKLDSMLSVVNSRARAFVVLLDYLAQHK